MMHCSSYIIFHVLNEHGLTEIIVNARIQLSGPWTFDVTLSKFTVCHRVPRENALDTDCRPIIRYHYSTLKNYNHIKSGFATHYEHNPTLNLSNIYNYFQFSEVYLFLIRFFCIPTYVASFINRPFSRVLSIIPPQKICRQKNIPPKIFRQFLPADNSFPEKE